ncbi:ABC transporter ATP-binding protein [Liquorilactobacillus sucicola DSM 21376 = JCM 15457]|uniref:ABC transporter ATP-binding protein n=1 Tax=Liquorilactobacillus sucicola DSM 21376 = JCM 15457 TaxID=1423806 RepID=A0A023CV88_9LACO|nr:ABC transporter ATP-binding protein [Liquorilactobacillus sucicola]KRN05614.1 ABC transporter ATP-binding protein [Liquorilactobacillus sucicola DSM 21376 = JCM 15457]GAJ25699.1 ABC transporter ATP-binding protein [Liquorilactobacillus sucicola DSM 21376 = JCM 15457]
MNVLDLNHIRRVFADDNKNKVTALKDVSLSVDTGEYVAIMGESGAGKTTLLNIIATLDKATSGSITLNNIDLNKLPEKQTAKFRREHLGFVFQNFNLLDTFNNRDNIFLPLVLAKKKYAEMEQRLRPLAEQLEITDLLNRYPYEISGGQKQRVAAARALITKPDLVLADEPTGALDSHNTEKLLQLFEKVNVQGQTILMVTHSAAAASHSKRTLFIKDGQIYHEIFKGDYSRSTYLKKIMTSLTALSSKEE